MYIYVRTIFYHKTFLWSFPKEKWIFGPQISIKKETDYFRYVGITTLDLNMVVMFSVESDDRSKRFISDICISGIFNTFIYRLENKFTFSNFLGNSHMHCLKTTLKEGIEGIEQHVN